MTRRAHIGFDRRIDIEWLDAAAAQAVSGASPKEMRAFLWKLLDGVISGDKAQSARGKTVTVLNHIWGEAVGRRAALCQRATAQLASCTPEERLALHWAMMVGSYPVFTDVAAAAGRLLTLQGSFTLSHLTRRLAASWGERSTLGRAAQRIVRSMIQWRALQDTSVRGEYRGVPGRIPVSHTVGLVLVEAILVDADESSISLDQLIGHPALFPFDVDVNESHVRNAPPFQVHRQGLDIDHVELRR